MLWFGLFVVVHLRTLWMRFWVAAWGRCSSQVGRCGVLLSCGHWCMGARPKPFARREQFALTYNAAMVQERSSGAISSSSGSGACSRGSGSSGGGACSSSSGSGVEQRTDLLAVYTITYHAAVSACGIGGRGKWPVGHHHLQCCGQCNRCERRGVLWGSVLQYIFTYHSAISACMVGGLWIRGGAGSCPRGLFFNCCGSHHLQCSRPRLFAIWPVVPCCCCLALACACCGVLCATTYIATFFCWALGLWSWGLVPWPYSAQGGTPSLSMQPSFPSLRCALGAGFVQVLAALAFLVAWGAWERGLRP